jgi:NADH dehydrogenase (ubiquinone) flavoprotein 2
MFKMLRRAGGAVRPLQRRVFHTSRVASSGGLVVHKDIKGINDDDTPFEWTADSLKKIEWSLKKYPSNYKQSGVMPLLYIAQEQEGSNNWLTLNAMRAVAKTLDMPEIRVFEVASFYTMFNRTPVGKYHIQLCGTTPCQLCGAEGIKQAIEDHLGIKEGETTADGLFTLTEVECLGACVNAPMIQVNNKEFYEFLTPENMVGLLDDWKAGKTPKAFNQNHVKTCEGPMGKTSLLWKEPPAAPCRDLDALKATVEAAAKEAAAKEGSK